jgi:hypothetical protein
MSCLYFQISLFCQLCRLGELEQRCNEQMQRILQQISASQTAGRESWKSDTLLKAGAGVGEREKEPDVYNVERKTRQTPSSRTQMAAPSPAAAHPPSIPPGSGLNYTSPGLFCSPDSNPVLNRVGFTQQGAGQSDWEKVKKQEWILLFDPSNTVLENQNLTVELLFSVLAVAEAKRDSCLLTCPNTRCYLLLTLISHADPLSIFVSTAFTFRVDQMDPRAALQLKLVHMRQQLRAFRTKCLSSAQIALRLRPHTLLA